MSNSRTRVKTFAALAVACTAGAIAGLCSMVVNAVPIDTSDQIAAPAAGMVKSSGKARATATASTVHLDRSGQKQVGIASFYAKRYSGKTMADGTPMHLYSSNAASLTLPLGSTAMVTNLETGKSATVTIRDRGPYVKGRIIDLSPATAQSIGIDRRQGLAKVEVTPVSVPMVDGSVWHAGATVARN